MATFARQQETAIDSGDPASVSITPSATTSLLIAMMSERSGTGHTPHTVTDNSGGDTWTKIGGHDQELANANARHSASWWWKEAGTTSAITVSADDGTANNKGLTVYEFTTDVDGTWTQREIASADTGTGSDGTTGITVTPDSVSAGDNLCMAFGGWRVNGAGFPDFVAFSGSYADLYTSGSDETNGRMHANEWFQDSDGGVEATTLTWNGAGHEGLCAVIIFELVTGGGGATVEPGVASLTLTGQAPTVLTPRTVTPGVLSLVTAGLAATVTATQNQFARPGNASLATELFAATVAATLNQFARPGNASLATELFAATVTATQNQFARPTNAALATEGFGPTVTATQHRLVEPGNASLLTSLFAPTIQAGGGQTVTPDVLALVTSLLAPTVLSPRTVTPETASLLLASLSPLALLPKVVSPGALALVTAAFAASVLTPRVVQPGPLSLVTQGFGPTVATPRVVSPGVASLTTSLFAPSVALPVVARPGLISLTAALFAPTVSAPVLVVPGAASLVVAQFAPAVSFGGTVVLPGVLLLTITGLVPLVLTTDVSDPAASRVYPWELILLPEFIPSGYVQPAPPEYPPSGFTKDSARTEPWNM